MKAGDEIGWKQPGKRLRECRYVGLTMEGLVVVELAKGKTRAVEIHEVWAPVAQAPLVRQP